jgi:hypothetical protein
MLYLTSDHKTPIASITHNGKVIPTAPLIARGDTAKLRELGIYPHHPNTDPAPLGVEWVLEGSEYYQRPIGTPEARDAAQLDAAKSAKQSERSQLRVEKQTGGFTFDGARYASDREESIPLLSNCAINAMAALSAGSEAVAAFSAALGDGWRSLDGIGRVTTAEGIIGLHTAFVAHGAACDHHSQTLKAQIEAAETLAELEAIDVEAGWPE